MASHLFRCGYDPCRTGLPNSSWAAAADDLLNHVIVLNERHLKRLMTEYVRYYHLDRTHIGLMPTNSRWRAVAKCETRNKVVSMPRLGGLHHRYDLAWQARSQINSEQSQGKRTGEVCLLRTRHVLCHAFILLRDHPTARFQPKTPARATSEFKNQLRFAYGWHFGEGQHFGERQPLAISVHLVLTHHIPVSKSIKSRTSFRLTSTGYPE